jgi:UDP-N-acetylglucosamine 1-carboxyvinyltransferase
LRLRIEGKAPLNGIYRPSGNTNAAQALTAAALLTTERVTLHNFPDTLSAAAMLSQAERLGASISHTGNSVQIQAEQLARRVITQQEMDASVGALMLLAPLLVRRRYARLETDYPLNRIRTHLEALRDLGFDLMVNSGAVDIKAINWERKNIVLTQTSVTATAILMMVAACLGKETTIHNAASEPHVQQLGQMLVAMGAQIAGIGSNVIRVYGVEQLHEAGTTICADHVEAASVAVLCALTGGRAQVDGMDGVDMRLIGKMFWRLGIQIDLDETSLFIPRHEILSVSNREEDVDSSIETAPWPGFPSDLVAVATVAATQSRGTSLIHEKLFHNRLLFIDKLKAMGAQIVLCDPHRAIVMGATPLRGIYMDSPDVRTGLGMLTAALVAEHETVIDNAQALQQSFGGVVEKLQALNAKISLE